MSKPGTRVIIDASGRPSVQKLRVEIRKGPDKGTTKDLSAEPVRIGTSEGCEVRLTDSSVSGVHTEISRTEHGILMRDLGSTNGSWVDGRRIQGVFADSSATITIGESEVRVSLLSEESPLEVAADDRCGDLVGTSVSMRATFAKLLRVAKTNTTVLITGETGTGKELAAAAIRDYSDRAKKPLVVIDCGAMPANLIESELFGHERGAFTGADRARAGAFERADGGTIFLDEIGELPLPLQPALLGILERREARRVGGQKPIPVDIRIIAATNRDLADEVARGAFRADLFYRLAVVEIRLPPLRERPEDIPMLIEHFLSQLPGDRPTMSPETMAQLKSYPWPGNARELRNVIERAALLSEAPKPRTDPVNPRGTAPPDAKTGASGTAVDIDRPFKELKNTLIADFEEGYVRKLLESTRGNIAAAARKARIDRMYLYKLIDRYHIEVSKT